MSVMPIHRSDVLYEDIIRDCCVLNMRIFLKVLQEVDRQMLFPQAWDVYCYLVAR